MRTKENAKHVLRAMNENARQGFHNGAPPPKGMPKQPATQWVKPGTKVRIKHLRGVKDLRHASPQDFGDGD